MQSAAVNNGLHGARAAGAQRSVSPERMACGTAPLAEPTVRRKELILINIDCGGCVAPAAQVGTGKSGATLAVLATRCRASRPRSAFWPNASSAGRAVPASEAQGLDGGRATLRSIRGHSPAMPMVLADRWQPGSRNYRTRYTAFLQLSRPTVTKIARPASDSQTEPSRKDSPNLTTSIAAPAFTDCRQFVSGAELLTLQPASSLGRRGRLQHRRPG
jgi:hypothetical protein